MESVDRVMVVGGGGREQAIAQKLASEGLEVIVSPGNPGNEDFAHSTGVKPTDIVGQLKAAEKHNVDLTVVGAEGPLDRGIAKAWEVAQVFGDLKGEIFAPELHQARIETDRSFAKQLAIDQGVPTGPYATFADKAAALDYAARTPNWPLFVKDNGSGQGKATTPCKNMHDVKAAIKKLEHIVIEANVPGPEASHHAFCDGKTHLSIPFVVRDHKQLGENDTGPMTGGMGVVGPLESYSSEEVEQLGETFASPVVKELGFKGLLFSGLKGPKGNERNLEWNARFGDPEAQVFMRLMKSDLLPVLMACVEGDLESTPQPEWFMSQYAACLVLAAPGYPGKPRKNMLIEGLDVAAETDSVQILQAGTKDKKGKLYTKGGRVLNLVAVASTLRQAVQQTYQAAEVITFDGQPPLMRPDIGRKTLAGY